jgi:hypothetical protein
VSGSRANLVRVEGFISSGFVIKSAEIDWPRRQERLGHVADENPNPGRRVQAKRESTRSNYQTA